MSLNQFHAGFANTATLFIAALGVWALGLRFTSRSLNASWYGATVVGEIVIVLQGLVGLLLYLQGQGALLPRPFMHVLYGVVAVLTLPAAYSYLGRQEDERVKAIVMGLVCLFLWGILLRASSVAQFPLA